MFYLIDNRKSFFFFEWVSELRFVYIWEFVLGIREIFCDVLVVSYKC